MKKMNAFKIAALALALPLASCLKDDDVEPITGKNSVLQLQTITFNNLIASSQASIKGVAKVDFYQAKDSTGNITDTTSFTDTFYVSNPMGYTQTYDFDTPEKTKKFRFQVYFKIEGDGTASGLSVSKLLYKANGNTYLDQPLSFTTTDNKLFTTDVQTVNF